MDKFIEWFGVTLAACGFLMLSTGFMAAGFLTGLLSCFALLIFFGKSKQWGVFSLQLFFTFANILGLINN